MSIFAVMSGTGLTPQLRSAIRRSKLTRYRIAQLAEVSESSISRFMNGKCGLSLDAIDRIWAVLKLQVCSGEEHDDGE